MANLNYLFTINSSIEHMLNKFEERDKREKLKYSTLSLTPACAFGSYPKLKVSFLISRTKYLTEGALTFTEFKTFINTSSGYINSVNASYLRIVNEYIDHYISYVREIMYKQPIEEKIYEFDSPIMIGGRAVHDKYRRKYGECRLYVLRAVKILPYDRNWRQWSK